MEQKPSGESALRLLPAEGPKHPGTALPWQAHPQPKGRTASSAPQSCRSEHHVHGLHPRMHTVEVLTFEGMEGSHRPDRRAEWEPPGPSLPKIARRRPMGPELRVSGGKRT